MNLLLILFLFLCKNITNIVIKIPFKKEKITSISSLLDNNIYTTIELGTPIQTLKISIFFNEINLVIPCLNFSSISNNFFNQSKSKTFYNESLFTMIRLENKYRFEYQEFRGKFSTENFYFLDENNNKIKFEKFGFLQSFSDLNFNNISIIKNGFVGLKFKESFNNIDQNILYQLKNSKNENSIKSYSISIIYNNNFEGNIFIGDFPHEFEPKKFSFEYFKSKHINLDFYNFNWKINFDKIYYLNENNFEFDLFLTAKFDLNFGGILANSNYQKNVNESFFNEYFNKKKCENKIIKQKENNEIFYVYECDKKININKFNENIYFYSKEFNFTFVLDKNDLFLKFNDKIYFLVFFSDYFPNWILGEPFFKKFNMIFNQEKKIVGFYSDFKKIKKNYDKIIIIFLLICLIVCLLFFINKIYFKKNKKIRANELEDNYVYEAKNYYTKI